MEAPGVRARHALQPAADGAVDWAWARGAWTVNQLPASSGLPPWCGNGLTPPPGHDAHVQFETTAHAIQFRVGVTVDFQVAS